jgi:tetratricopeptide (TPR) repeat protein
MGLAFDHSHVGEAQASTGNLHGALESYLKSLSILVGLLQKDPANPHFLRGEMIAHHWLGHFAGNPRTINRGDTQTALRHYRKAQAVAKRLAAMDSKSAPARLDLAGGYKNIAEILSTTDPPQSVELYRKSLSIVRALLQPAPFMYLRREANYLKGIAVPLRAMGDREGALANLERSLDIMRSLTEKAPSNLKVQSELHATLLAIAEMLLETGDHDGALSHYRQSLSMAETPAAAASPDIYAVWRLADS